MQILVLLIIAAVGSLIWWFGSTKISAFPKSTPSILKTTEPSMALSPSPLEELKSTPTASVIAPSGLQTALERLIAQAKDASIAPQASISSSNLEELVNLRTAVSTASPDEKGGAILASVDKRATLAREMAAREGIHYYCALYRLGAPVPQYLLDQYCK